MKARAEELERQNKIMEATKGGFLALGELGPVVARFDAAVTALRELGESKRDIAKTFGLSVSVLTMLEQFLPVTAEAIGGEAEPERDSTGLTDVDNQDCDTVSSSVVLEGGSAE